jgi:hypothetical protein
LRYLRFSPDDYRRLATLWHELIRDGHPQTAFKRLLIEALSGLSPNLAGRITRLHRDEFGILSNHFRERTHSARGHDLTAEELQAVLEACVSPPFRVRFVRPFKDVLVELFQETWPELSRKVARLSGHQFERLYEHAGKQSRGNS